MKNGKKISLEEYQKAGKDWLYIDREFYEGLDNYIEYITNFLCEEELEDYEIPVIYGADYEKVELDAEDIIGMLESHSVRYSDCAPDEAAVGFIVAFVKEYNEKYAEMSLVPSKDTIIELTEEEKAEIRTAVYERLEKAGLK